MSTHISERTHHMIKKNVTAVEVVGLWVKLTFSFSPIDIL